MKWILRSQFCTHFWNCTDKEWARVVISIAKCKKIRETPGKAGTPQFHNFFRKDQTNAICLICLSNFWLSSALNERSLLSATHSVRARVVISLGRSRKSGKSGTKKVWSFGYEMSARRWISACWVQLHLAWFIFDVMVIFPFLTFIHFSDSDHFWSLLTI